MCRVYWSTLLQNKKISRCEISPRSSPDSPQSWGSREVSSSDMALLIPQVLCYNQDTCAAAAVAVRNLGTEVLGLHTVHTAGTEGRSLRTPHSEEGRQEQQHGH